MDLSKIIHLFESKHTEALSDRHASAIMKLCRQYQSEGRGFFYKELDDVQHIFSLSFSSIQNGKTELVPAVIQLVELCKIPFAKEKSRDENLLKPLLPKFFNSLCPLLCFDAEGDGNPVFDQLVVEIASLVSEIASFGI